MDNRTLAYMGLGALTGIAVAALIQQRGRMAYVLGRGGGDISDYRHQSGEGAETTERGFEKRDEEMFRAEVEN